jgi:hypothetical protein
LPKLPSTTITFGLPSFRLPDDLILAATSFSGIAAFIELVDTDAAAKLPDPLKTRLQEVVRQARVVLALVALTRHSHDPFNGSAGRRPCFAHAFTRPI